MGKHCFNCALAKTIRVGHLDYNERKTFNPNHYVLLREDKSSTGNFMGLCKKGLNTDFKEMWLAYGNKPYEEAHHIEMSCHESSEGMQILNKLSDGLDEIKKYFDDLETKKKESL